MIRFLAPLALLTACGPTPEEIAAMPFPTEAQARVAVEGDLILFLEEGATIGELADLLTRFPEVAIGRDMTQGGDIPIVLVYVPHGQEREYALRLMKEPKILRAERNWVGGNDDPLSVSVTVL